MVFTLSFNQLVSICVAKSEAPFIHAAGLLRDQLALRGDLEIEVAEFGQPRRSHFDILLCDAESLPVEIQSLLDPPPKIMSCPDYADHFHLSLLEDYDTPTLVLFAGAPQGLIYAIGYLLQQIGVYSDRIDLPDFNHTRRPLNPLRGFLFGGQEGPNGSPLQHALWGDNCSGARGGSEQNKLALPIKQIEYCCRGFHSTEPSDIVCIRADDDIEQCVQAAVALSKQKETWIDASDLNEAKLDELLLSQLDGIHALAHDAQSENFALLQRESPLNMQLVALCQMNNLSASDLARRRAEAAPLIYAALGVSTGEPEWARFVWSALSWSPIRSLAEIFESYGRCYFGGEAAEAVCDALERGDQGGELSITLSDLNECVPKAMRALANERLA